MTKTTAELPVIDIAAFTNGSAAERQAAVRALAAACEDAGFFFVTGHGVPDALISRTRQAAVDFFALPLDDKMAVERPPSKISRGYNRLGDRSLSYSLGIAAPPDLQEAWAMGPLDIPDDPYFRTPDAENFFAPNRWPDRPDAFRDTLTDYYGAMSDLSATVMSMFASALDLSSDFFRDKTDRHCSIIRLVRYPTQDESPEEDQLRAGAHTDYDTLTFVSGDDVPGGLQIRHRTGGWIDVSIPPGMFVCNIGDAMARWTNDRWVSTLHRVGNPPAGAPNVDRISLVFFHLPNYDTVLSGIESCRKADGTDTYPPVTFAEHYNSKVMKAAHQRLDASMNDSPAAE